MKRRTFLKTAGALSGSLIALPFSTYLAAESHTSPTKSEAWEICNDRQRIEVASSNGAVTYQSFVRDDKGGWAAASVPGNQFVSGPGFQFAPASGQVVKSSADSVLELAGNGQAREQDGAPFQYTWNTSITSLANSPWFRFATTLHLPHDMKLHQGEVLEPQIILWLSSVSTLMEGQSGSWRRTLLEQPTRNSVGMAGRVTTCRRFICRMPIPASRP